MLVTVTWIATEAPRLISIMAITAATPMITPSMVSTVRITLRRRACKRDPHGAASHAQAVARTSPARATCRRTPARRRPPASPSAVRGIFHDPAVGNANHAIGVAGHFGVVRHQQDRDALLHVQPAEDLQDFLAGVRIQVPRGLVGQQHGGLVHQRAGDGHALLLAAGELRRRMVQPRLQADAWPAVRGSAAALAGANVFSAE